MDERAVRTRRQRHHIGLRRHVAQEHAVSDFDVCGVDDDVCARAGREGERRAVVAVTHAHDGDAGHVEVDRIGSRAERLGVVLGKDDHVAVVRRALPDGVVQSRERLRARPDVSVGPADAVHPEYVAAVGVENRHPANRDAIVEPIRVIRGRHIQSPIPQSGRVLSKDVSLASLPWSALSRVLRPNGDGALLPRP